MSLNFTQPMNQPSIKIVIYEDNPDLRESLSVLLRGSMGFELIGAFVNCEQVARQIIDLRPDVVLMDIDMPIANGLKGLKVIKQLAPQVNVIMFTVFEDNENIFEAICSGAVGYLLKRTPPIKLLEAIQDANNGGAPMTSSIARKILQMLPAQQKITENNDYKLTEREGEILNLLVKGNSYKMIADKCSISIDTVRSHIKKIYDKLHVHSQTEAVAKAIHERIV
ncbi:MULTISPECIES: response regulator transcription factor [unclassified Arcicella]|uniref:response regulator transcription factor n=1 Tax=unclassified Arcicella TaxID=2644986 RepID=UPI002855296A|nr:MULTISPECIES: response regulator transcription factor [unclassified Arcicella]MDR6564302.1 DNA-binding NarL/FixJ family response regulator [Arcicella sp. BE51]MDR6814053.1 DNA-binding NarL/FixJ family response regulator [Arcicella sp. BE140]MDR6825365.1 DNA-binding NarL/FixJ family response regulator [Arcicella sp. BE139]